MNEETMQARQIIEKWHQALNQKDKAQLAALVQADVKIGGPKGETEGIPVLLEWVDRANISLFPQKYFRAGNTFLVEEAAAWHHPETGDLVGSQVVVSVFTLANNLIARINRYDNLSQALTASGLQPQDLKILPGNEAHNFKK
ncbi:nuclear transport factor 2 family protein [Adhaeribacter pallidiroseus]|uniref:Uncharacterized protein n=1 Tax=Adhaeribacter pallidiroseus TaxID=2072847 RepID=A0A369QFZ5_9BACT|nr:nuclear transport factor 2 family protein [Adhaeribacter pallidiroseus]RDC62187.1 hypothetical protein AHMF7616_00778 [Adhaeribacter pallidiroseus]